MRAIALLLAAALSYGSVHAQVPPRVVYQGFLTSPVGVPVTATFQVVFRLWDLPSGGSALWTEIHPSVTVTNGIFNVVLGSVTPINLAFDAPYFLGVTAGMDSEMVPRQALAASPYAFRAKVADTATTATTAATATTATTATTISGTITGSQVTGPISVAAVIESTSGGMKFPDGKTQTKALADCSAEGDVAVVQGGAWVCKSSLPRYVDNGNGTVTDNQTGLVWEKKLASGDAACTSATQASRDVRCVQNTYSWSAASPFTEPTGTLYSDFLQQLNGLNFSGGAACFAAYCDWRIPTIGELRSILLAPYPCGSNPCIDAIFGPTQATSYWSSSTVTSNPVYAWSVGFNDGAVNNIFRNDDHIARTVRGGR